MYWAVSTKLPCVTKSGVLDTQKYTNRMTAIARMLASRWRRNSWPARAARPLLAPGLPGGGPMTFALRSAVSLTSLSNLGVAAWDLRIYHPSQVCDTQHRGGPPGLFLAD